MASSFRSLAAWRLSAALADELSSQVLRWPDFQRQSMGLQLMRAIDAVGANIAEAVGRWSAADKRRILYIARGELYETEHWLDRARRRGLLTNDYSGEIAEIARALNGLISRPGPR